MESGVDSVLGAIVTFIAKPTIPSPSSIAIFVVGLAVVICAVFAFKRPPSKQKQIRPIRRR